MAELTCYDCIHCGRCNDIEGGYSCHCSDVSKCKHFKNKVDFVEVVRCKDCEYWMVEKDLGIMFCNHWASVLTESQADDFCSYGVRKEKTDEQKRNT